MAEQTRLCRIKSARFGMGGYQGVQFGLHLSFEGKGWGTSASKCHWIGDPISGAQWTAEERDRDLAETCHFVADTLKKAGVESVAALVGTPIEATFDGNLLTGWRVLEEVLP